MRALWRYVTGRPAQPPPAPRAATQCPNVLGCYERLKAANDTLAERLSGDEGRRPPAPKH